MTQELFVQMGINGLTLALMYVLLGLGMVLLYSVMGILYFAAGQTYMLGAFASYYLSVVLGINFGLTLILTTVVLGIVGIIIEKVLFRRVRGKLLPAFIVSLGLAYLLENGSQFVFGTRGKSIPSLFPGGFEILGAILTWDRLIVIVGSLASIAALYLFLTRTKAGLALRAFVDDAEAAELQGISNDRVCTLGFFIACALAGLAGALVAPLVSIETAMGMPVSLKACIIIGLGGLGSISGAALAGLILGFIDSFGSSLVGAGVTWGVSFFMLVILLAIRPRGLMGIDRVVRI